MFPSNFDLTTKYRSYNSSVVAGTNLLLVRVRVNSTYCETKTKEMRRMEQDILFVCETF
jgi:hypothetical protein